MKNYQYSPPADFQARNSNLLSTLADLLGAKSKELKDFRELSSRFRNSGKMSAKEYFEGCVQDKSDGVITAFLPELIALLPDIKKQEALLILYSQRYPESARELAQCFICGQVLTSRDICDHDSSHLLDEDFPTL
eukprot:TRINITY_DN24963_c0_g1_i1.p1 TRINITY_DN24963_c0_g1~~TRINITY_DN24963_c0_g1_i1.p1  ORF type:complete len:155 (+),score=35.50 TRINITY_DN24963_c0_g1_i1:63-467(+)